jgi:hypothetical protein
VWLATFAQVDLKRMLLEDAAVNLHETVVHVSYLTIVPASAAGAVVVVAVAAADDHGIDDPSRNHLQDLRPAVDICLTCLLLFPSSISRVRGYGELLKGTELHHDRHLYYTDEYATVAYRVNVDKLAYVLLNRLDSDGFVEKDFEALNVLDYSPYDLIQCSKDLPFALSFLSSFDVC